MYTPESMNAGIKKGEHFVKLGNTTSIQPGSLHAFVEWAGYQHPVHCLYKVPQILKAPNAQMNILLPYPLLSETDSHYIMISFHCTVPFWHISYVIRCMSILTIPSSDPFIGHHNPHSLTWIASILQNKVITRCLLLNEGLYDRIWSALRIILLLPIAWSWMEGFILWCLREE